MHTPSDVTPGWFATVYSERLKGRRRKDTKPELLLRKALHALGLRYRLQYRVGPRLAADIAFPAHRLVLWVDGCFWHGCPKHGRATFRGPNARQWEQKIARNQARDRHAVDLATAQGWRALRIWECQVADDPVHIAQIVRRLVDPRADAQGAALGVRRGGGSVRSR